MLKLLLYLIFTFVGSECAKILAVFPTPSISHQVVFRPLMIELARRGHEVTVITTDPAFPKGQAPTNLTEIDVHDMSYDHKNEVVKQSGNEKDPLKFLSKLSDATLKIVEMQLKSSEVQEYLKKNKKIDLLFVESYVRPALIYSYIYDAPVIEFSSISAFLSTFDNVGAATHPMLYPDAMNRRIYNLTIVEKVAKLYVRYLLNRLFKEHADKETELFKQYFGQDMPHLDILKRNIDMTFLNVHPIWDFNRPVPPNVIYLGGLHQNPEKELPKELKSYLDSSKKGVVYISFGTNFRVSLFPPEKFKIFTDVIYKLPYDVLWKWDSELPPGRPDNVKISKWLPQSDLLKHPNIKLFITQGGLQSTDEAITAGVPMIGLPVYADQWFNAEQYVNFKIGKKHLVETLTEDELMESIETVINDESYRQNILKLRDVMHDQPHLPLQRAVWWTEHVLRHGGGTHLRANGAGLDWTEYYEIELILWLLAAIVSVLSIIIPTIYLIVKKIRSIMKLKIKFE